MKNKPITVAVLATLALMSCENPMRFETKVHEDGSLDKTIVMQKTDSSRILKNIFGASSQSGWKTDIHKLPEEKSSDKKKSEFEITFQKHFSDCEAINNALDGAGDTLFHIHSKFENKFRWFYTYIRYSESFRSANRFKLVSPDDYFNGEDNAFIDRLPAEGKAVSKADSLFLQVLNEKIFDRFAIMGIYKEQYDILQSVIKKNGLGKAWLDTLTAHQDFIYNHLDKMKGDSLFAEKMADSLKIPLNKAASSKDFAALSKSLNNRINFMSFAKDGKYQNVIEMPWEVVASNADSVSGNKLYWRPLFTKFAYRDYEMFAESRKLNIWACIVSIVVIAGTGYFSFRKGNR